MSISTKRAPREDLRAIAERLRAVATLCGTQALAARAAGVSPRQYRAYVSARSEPTAGVLANLMRSTTLSANWLLTGEGAPDTSHAEGKALADESMVRILKKRVAELEAELAARKPEPDSAFDSYRKLAQHVHARLARIAELVPTDTTNVGWGEVGTLTEVDSQLRNIVGFLEGSADGR